jgi:non-canonical (house-cleaning) NTP pyrophosphatase
VDAAVEAIDVGDVAPRMPTTDRETLAGARARAWAVYGGSADGRTAETGRPRSTGEPRPPNVLAIGVEGGIAPLPIGEGGSERVLVSWAAATDGTQWGYGSGGVLLPPDRIASEVLGGCELGDVIDRLAGSAARNTGGAWGVLTRDLIGRRDAYTVAVVAALAPFYNATFYTPG